MELTDDQWQLIKTLIPEPHRREDGRGRPWRGNREVLEGILWIGRTGAPWKDMPKEFPPYQTCHRRMQQWVQNGTFEKVLVALAKDLEKRGGLDLREAFIDGTFSPAKKGGLVLGKQKREKAPKSWELRTAMVFQSPFGLKVLRQMK